MTGDDILFFCCLVVSFSSGAVVMSVCGCAVFVIRVVMTRILFCEILTLISDILYYRYLSHYFGWGSKGNVLFGIGSDFFLAEEEV